MIKGKMLMIGVETSEGVYDTIAMATSCQMNVSTTLSDATTKDDNDAAQCQEVTGKAWDLSTDNLIPASGSSTNVDWLVDRLMAGTKVKVRFSCYEGSLGKETGDAHTWNGVSGVSPEVVIYGQAMVESVSVNGANKENATLNAKFKGCGAPTLGAIGE